MAGIGYVFFKCYCSPQSVSKTTPRRLTYVTLFANPHVFVTSSAVLNRKTSPSGLPDVCAHLYHICTTSVPRCMTSVPRLHDVCATFARRLHDITFWWRIKNVLRTCPWQVLDTCFSSVIAVPRTFGKPHQDVLPM